MMSRFSSIKNLRLVQSLCENWQNLRNFEFFTLKHELIIPLVAFFVKFFFEILFGSGELRFSVADFWYRYVNMRISIFYLTPLEYKKLQKNFCGCQSSTVSGSNLTLFLIVQ